MKKNIKNIIPVLVIAGIISTSIGVRANSTDKNKEQNIAITKTELSENQIIINGNTINEKFMKKGEKVLFPARAVFETLGYEVGWDSKSKVVTLTKIPHFITFSTLEDAYTFSRTAPMPLGQAPIVKDGITYVPLNLLTELMQMENVSFENNILKIDEASAQEENNSINSIEIIDIDKENNTVTVNDSEKGQVVLNIKGLKIDFTTDAKELSIGQNLEVEYGDVMTRSIPPMNNPKSVKVVYKVVNAEVLEISKDEKDNYEILVLINQMGEVRLNISKDMKIDGIKLEEIKKGQKLEVVLSEAMTMSIPPMNNPKSIKFIQENETENPDVIVGKATISAIDKEANQVTVKDDEKGEIILNISDDVKIEFENEDKELKVGQKLQVEYSPIMTRSLPPLNNPFKITVLK